jgi:hypothetical protein
MKSAALTTLTLTVAITLLTGVPSAGASPELDYCRAMAAAGVPGDCATLAGFAKDVCAQYDRGLDMTSIVERLDVATKNEAVSNFVMAGAPMYFCPEHRGKNGGGGGI